MQSERPTCRYLGPKNTEAVVGHSWRWARDHARAWGVPMLRVDGKTMIVADRFFRALEANATTSVVDEADELERMRERVRRAG